MNGDKVGVFLLYTAVIAFGFFLLGALSMSAQWRDKLVKSGHAEYYLDTQNNKKWRMKGEKE